MKNKRLLSSFVIFSLLILQAACAAASPMRIAILPLINQTGYHNAGVEGEIQRQLAAQFHIPLNGVLKRVAFVAPEDISDALRVYNPSQTNGLKELAAVLQADYIVGMVVTTAYEHRSDSVWLMDPMLDSRLELALIGYTKSGGQIIDLKQSANYHGRDTSFGSIRYLADEVIQKLFKKADLKTKIQQESKE